jgi:hypothetical protein
VRPPQAENAIHQKILTTTEKSMLPLLHVIDNGCKLRRAALTIAGFPVLRRIVSCAIYIVDRQRAAPRFFFVETLQDFSADAHADRAGPLRRCGALHDGLPGAGAGAAGAAGARQLPQTGVRGDAGKAWPSRCQPGAATYCRDSCMLCENSHRENVDMENAPCYVIDNATISVRRRDTIMETTMRFLTIGRPGAARTAAPNPMRRRRPQA